MHGANGGVGSVLVQLALSAGARVIGTASARHEAPREQRLVPVDHRAGDVATRIRALAPGGVDAVFDHVGGRGITAPWRLLAPGGTLVSYGSASTRDDEGSKQWPVRKLLLRVWTWNALPNRRAPFSDVCAGKALAERRFRFRLRADLTQVFDALQRGEVTAWIATQLPLEGHRRSMLRRPPSLTALGGPPTALHGVNPRLVRGFTTAHGLSLRPPPRNCCAIKGCCRALGFFTEPLRSVERD